MTKYQGIAIQAGAGIVLLAQASLAFAQAATPPQVTGEWRSLFNGRDLEGWIPKVNHRPLGENYRDTFVVKDGVLRVSYDKYERFTDEFAHLIYKTPFSHYRVRLDYRFIGKATPGAPDWAVRNSGVMLHGQAPETIGLDQPFPVSIEAQFLGGDGTEVRPTGNLCTPGTSVTMKGVAGTSGCYSSSSRTYSDGQWVHVEIEVHGSKRVRHIIDGEVVLEYENIRLDPTSPLAGKLRQQGSAVLGGGYISLQGESHPIEFRNIEIMILSE